MQCTQWNRKILNEILKPRFPDLGSIHKPETWSKSYLLFGLTSCYFILLLHFFGFMFAIRMLME